MALIVSACLPELCKCSGNTAAAQGSNNALHACWLCSQLHAGAMRLWLIHSPLMCSWAAVGVAMLLSFLSAWPLFEFCRLQDCAKR